MKYLLDRVFLLANFSYIFQTLQCKNKIQLECSITGYLESTQNDSDDYFPTSLLLNGDVESNPTTISAVIFSDF